jgi:hypothetical protein
VAPPEAALSLLVFWENGMGSVHERANRILLAGALGTLGLLAGCVTPEERAIRKQAEVEQMMTVYGPACQRLGYTPNTDPWRSCVLQLNVQDDLLRYQTSPGYCGNWGTGYWHNGCW